MKGLVFLGMTVMCASAAFATANTDALPGANDPAVAPPGSYNPGFGSIIRSWNMGTMYTGISVHNDGYLTTGAWSPTLFKTFVVYTTTGSLVRTVPVTTQPRGYRGGSGKCHLGTGYFVTAQETSGCYRYTYKAGGNPGGTGTSIGMGRGRGISWDGTYYYATTGTYGTPFGKYTTTGSQVGVVPGTSHTLGNYDFSTPGNGYLYVGTQTGGYRLIEVSLATGSLIRTATAMSWPSGVDDAWSLSQVFVTHNVNNYCVVYDRSETAVAPVSLGKIKSLYR